MAFSAAFELKPNLIRTMKDLKSQKDIKIRLIGSFNIIKIEMKYDVNHESIPATLTQLARPATKNLIDKNPRN